MISVFRFESNTVCFERLCIYLLLSTIEIFALQEQIESIQDSSLLQTLSELPLDKLLHVKNSFEYKEIDEEPLDEEASNNIVGAQALQLKQNSYNRIGYDHNYNGFIGFNNKHSYEKKKAKDLSTVFQVSITALAFLAFGGYLLCLIVQAIKSKAEISLNMTDTQAETIRKRKHGLRKPREKRDTWPHVGTDDLYEALTMFSEGYAFYNKNIYSNS